MGGPRKIDRGCSWLVEEVASECWHAGGGGRRAGTHKVGTTSLLRTTKRGGGFGML